MPRKSFASIKRGQAILTNLEVTEEIEKEKIALAELLEQESLLNYKQAEEIINSICEEILPGYPGIERLTVFRERIRDRLRRWIERWKYDIDYEEALDHQQTISDARNLGNP